MNIETERKLFEAKYPVPEYGEWSSSCAKYVPKLNYMMGNEFAALGYYNDLFKVWLSRAELAEAGEAVATLGIALVGLYNSDYVYQLQLNPEILEDLGKFNALCGTLGHGIHKLFIAPPPSNIDAVWNEAIEAAAHAISRSVSKEHADLSVLALRKGVE